MCISVTKHKCFVTCKCILGFLGFEDDTPPNQATPPTAQTEHAGTPKSCINSLPLITFVTIGAIFDISPLGPLEGGMTGNPRGSKIENFFYPIFSIFSMDMIELRS